MRIISKSNPDGSMLFEAHLYKAYSNAGPLGDKLLDKTLRRIMFKGAPIWDDHEEPQIGELEEWQHLPSGWVKIRARIWGPARLSRRRYDEIRRWMMRGFRSEVSISVKMPFINGKYDQEQCTLREISICAKGKEKETHILTLEASADSVRKLSYPGGALLQLTMSRLEQIKEIATSSGLDLAEDELEQMIKSGTSEADVLVNVMQRISENARSTKTQLDAQNRELETVRKVQHEQFMEKRKPEIDELVELFKIGIPEDKQEAFSKVINEIGSGQKEHEGIYGVMHLMGQTAKQYVERANKAEKTNKELRDAARQQQQQQKNRRDASPTRQTMKTGGQPVEQPIQEAPQHVLSHSAKVLGQEFIDTHFGCAAQSSLLAADPTVAHQRSLLQNPEFLEMVRRTPLPSGKASSELFSAFAKFTRPQ